MSTINTSEPEFREPTQKTQALIRVLRAALPATTREEIAQKMTSLMKTKENAEKFNARTFAGLTLFETDTGYLLKHIRNPKNSKFYGWTVPHVRRGALLLGEIHKGKIISVYDKKDRGRYFSVPVSKEDGSLIIEDNENTSVITTRAKQGLLGTLQQIATMGKNESYAIEVLSRFDVVKRKKELDLIVKGLRFVSEITEEYIKACEEIKDIWDVAV